MSAWRKVGAIYAWAAIGLPLVLPAGERAWLLLEDVRIGGELRERIVRNMQRLEGCRLSYRWSEPVRSAAEVGEIAGEVALWWLPRPWAVPVVIVGS